MRRMQNTRGECLPAVRRLRLPWEGQCWQHRLLSQPDPSAWIPGMTLPGSAILGCLLNLQSNDLGQLIQHPFLALWEPVVTMHLHWLRVTAALCDGWFLSLSQGLSGPGEWPLTFFFFFLKLGQQSWCCRENFCTHVHVWSWLWLCLQGTFTQL